VLAFAMGDVLVKDLTSRHSAPLVIGLRFAVNLALLVIVLAPRHGPLLWRTERTWLVLLRALILCLGSLMMALALRRLPLGETVAILYLFPFATMILAVPLLGERVGLGGWLGAAAGFAGVLLILRPGTGLDPLGVVFALINTALAVAYHLMTRLLARTETTMALLFHVALTGTIVFCVAIPFTAQGPLPSPGDLGLMALLGVLATVGHFLLTSAYREAPASLLAPVNFLHLVWAGVLSWLVFGHLPDALSLAGMALVCAAGAAIALRAHFAR
jgi:drug/metabolite transporter (DMT)-like permease